MKTFTRKRPTDGESNPERTSGCGLGTILCCKPRISNETDHQQSVAFRASKPGRSLVGIACHMMHLRRRQREEIGAQCAFVGRAIGPRGAACTLPNYFDDSCTDARKGIKWFRMWWPGTESNRRRQPFQGCALPAELPGPRQNLF